MLSQTVYFWHAVDLQCTHILQKIFKQYSNQEIEASLSENDPTLDHQPPYNIETFDFNPNIKLSN